MQQNRHQVRDHDDGEQRVTELGTAGEVGGPVAGVHIADRDHVAGTREGHQAAEPGPLAWHRNRGMDLGQAGPGIAAGKEMPAGARVADHGDD